MPPPRRRQRAPLSQKTWDQAWGQVRGQARVGGAARGRRQCLRGSGKQSRRATPGAETLVLWTTWASSGAA
eukprot:5901358-Prymnesium_polylepis.2